MNIDIEMLFEQSFVINVDEDRLIAFKERFIAENLVPLPKIFPGFSYRNGVYRSAGIIKSSNAANVRLSNLAIVKMADAMNWPFVCIFEDDALPCIDAKQKLSLYLKNLPNDIDMLKLGWLCKSKIEKYSDMLSKALTFGSHAYVVFKKYYKQFQVYATRFFMTDGIAMSDPEHQLFCTNELLFIQDDRKFKTKVHIDNEKNFFNNMLKNNELINFNI